MWPRRNLLLCVYALCSGNLFQTPAFACNTHIKAYIDVSGSTDTTKYLNKFISSLKTTSYVGPMQVELVPFATTVGTSCAPSFDPRTQSVPPSCNPGMAHGVGTTTDLVNLTNALKLEMGSAVPYSTRRLVVVLSDFIHWVRLDSSVSLSDWIRRHEAPLKSLAIEVDRAGSQQLLLVNQPPNDPQLARSKELVGIAAYLNKNFRLADGKSSIDLLAETRDMILYGRPLKVRVTSIRNNTLQLELENPSCLDQNGIVYRLQPADPHFESIPPPTQPGLRGCPSTVNETKHPVRCDLEIPLLTADRDQRACQKYRVWATPAAPDSSAAGWSDFFTLHPCLEIRSVSLDIIPGDGEGSFPVECDVPTFDDLMRSDLTKGHDGDHEFIACIEATGHLQSGKAQFGFLETPRANGGRTTGDRSGFLDLVREAWGVVDPAFSGPISTWTEVRDVRRISENPIRPDARHSFPVFFRLSNSESRALCYNAHEEIPPRIEFGSSIDSGNLFSSRIYLYRNRNHEAEEQLHDLWESATFPLALLLFLVLLAIWGARRLEVDALEGYIGVIGLAVLAWGAAMHDATTLGDVVEGLFARFPKLSLLFLAIVVLSFSLLVALGTFEARQPAAAAAIEGDLIRLKDRFGRVQKRYSLWFKFLVGFFIFSAITLATCPKEIAECHYYGTSEQTAP